MTAPILRSWTDSDFEPYAEMNADPEVMRYFPAPLTRAEARESFERGREGIAEHGWGIWAVEVDGAFAGMTGLMVPRDALPFMPCVEILWRFRREYWGRGYAFAAAAEALTYGFATLGLPEVVAFTAVPNLRSIRLMERLGFQRDLSGDFDHPAVPPGHSLRRHVLYRKHSNRAATPIGPQP